VIGAVMLARREAPGSRGARDLAESDAIEEGGATDA